MKRIDTTKGEDGQLHHSYIQRVLNSTAIAGTTRQISRDMGSEQYYLDLVDIYKPLHPTNAGDF